MILANALLPVLALLITGAILQRLHLTNTNFFKTSDRLVYYVFFPLMLFWKIGGTPLQFNNGWQYLLASALAVITTCILSLFFIRLRAVPNYQAGSFNQGCYRFNTYIGMAVILNAYGAQAVQLYGILVGLLIPLVNVCVVAVLIWYGQEESSHRLAITLRHLLANPLILGCVAGILYAQYGGSFPTAVANTLKLTSQVTLPLALFSIGGNLRFSSLRQHFYLATAAAVGKLLILPLCGLIYLAVFRVTGLAFQVAMLFFSLPASTAIYIVSAQLHSDTELASAVIVVSTLLSFLSMSAVLLLTSSPLPV